MTESRPVEDATGYRRRLMGINKQSLMLIGSAVSGSLI